MSDDKKGVKKKFRKPSDRTPDNIEEFIKHGTPPDAESDEERSLRIPDHSEAEFGTSSVHAPYEVLDELDMMLKRARRKYGHGHSRTSITRVWFYALTHLPSDLQQELLSSEDETEMLHRILGMLLSEGSEDND